MAFSRWLSFTCLIWCSMDALNIGTLDSVGVSIVEMLEVVQKGPKVGRRLLRSYSHWPVPFLLSTFILVNVITTCSFLIFSGCSLSLALYLCSFIYWC